MRYFINIAFLIDYFELTKITFLIIRLYNPKRSKKETDIKKKVANFAPENFNDYEEY